MDYSVYPDFLLPKTVPAPALHQVMMSISEKLRDFYRMFEDDEIDYIVDLQGFKADGHFVHKELAVVALKSNTPPAVYLFKPPFSWETLSAERKRENSWIEKKLIGIRWSSGNFEYEDITKILDASLKKVKRIYVKGFEKKKWLEERLPTSAICKVVDMDILGCPALKHFPKRGHCENHSLLSEAQCAAQNVNALRFWMQTYRDIFGEDVYN